VQAAELAGKKMVLAKHKTEPKVRTREGLNKEFKAERSHAARGNNPRAKASADRLKVNGSAKARAKHNAGKTGLSRKVANGISLPNGSRDNANSGTNNSRASGNKTGVTSNSRGNGSAIEINNKVNGSRAVINSGVKLRAKGISSSKVNVRANATNKGSAMANKVASLAPRH